MTLRRIAFATTVLGGLCLLGLAYSGNSSATNVDPIRSENAQGAGNHDEAAARFRANQTNHWKHVVVGNYSSDR